MGNGVSFQMMHAGLHIESIEQAEQQVSLVCHVVKGVEVPFALSMMQVLFFVFCKIHLHLRYYVTAAMTTICALSMLVPDCGCGLEPNSRSLPGLVLLQ